MKKIISVILTGIFVLSMFAGCASVKKDGYRVAIVQQMDHASLDEIRLAIEAELDAKSKELGVAIEYKEFNGQNDATALNQIGAQIVDDNYDAIIPIATLAAQCMVTAADGKDIPVIYAAISDPETAGLTGYDKVTGTSDALNTAFILDMMLAINPDIQTVGLLYSNSEANSATPIAQAKAYLEGKNIAYLEKTGNTADEVLSAASALVGRVDAVFTPTDNVIMGAEAAVAEILNEAGIPHYTGADSFVAAGALLVHGAGGNQQHRDVRGGDFALDLAAHFEAVHHGHEYVGHDEVGGEAGGFCEAVAAVGGHDDVVVVGEEFAH